MRWLVDAGRTSIGTGTGRRAQLGWRRHDDDDDEEEKYKDENLRCLFGELLPQPACRRYSGQTTGQNRQIDKLVRVAALLTVAVIIMHGRREHCGR